MQYRRGRFILNSRFQIRFILYVASWLVALSFIYPLVISGLFDYFTRVLQSPRIKVDPSVLLEMKIRESDLLSLLIGFQVVLVAITLIISFFMSHRIAGPLHKLKKFFKEAENGNLRTDLQFRKGDYFKELADDYNAMMRSIQRQQNIQAVIHRDAGRSDKGDDRE